MEFNYENTILQFLRKLTDCVILSGLWILCSLPIFTVGATTTALYYATVKGLRRELGYSSKQFLKAFKVNFKRSTKVWLCTLAVYALGIVDCWILLKLWKMSGIIQFLFITIVVMLVLVTVWAFYVFPYIAKFENTTNTIIKNCFVILFANLPWSALLLIIMVVLLILTYFLPVVGFFIPGIFGLVSSLILERIFQKYMTPEDLEAELEEQKGGIR